MGSSPAQRRGRIWRRDAPLHISNKSPFRKRAGAPSADDEVIQNPDVDQRQCVAKPLGDELIRLARLSHSARMIVRKDHRGRVVSQSALHDFARMNARAVDRSRKQDFARDDPVSIVE